MSFSMEHLNVCTTFYNIIINIIYREINGNEKINYEMTEEEMKMNKVYDLKLIYIVPLKLQQVNVNLLRCGKL